MSSNKYKGRQHVIWYVHITVTHRLVRWIVFVTVNPNVRTPHLFLHAAMSARQSKFVEQCQYELGLFLYLLLSAICNAFQSTINCFNWYVKEFWVFISFHRSFLVSGVYLKDYSYQVRDKTLSLIRALPLLSISSYERTCYACSLEVMLRKKVSGDQKAQCRSSFRVPSWSVTERMQLGIPWSDLFISWSLFR